VLVDLFWHLEMEYNVKIVTDAENWQLIFQDTGRQVIEYLESYPKPSQAIYWQKVAERIAQVTD